MLDWGLGKFNCLLGRARCRADHRRPTRLDARTLLAEAGGVKFTWQSPLRFAAAVARSLHRFFAGLSVVAPEEVREQRASICRFCPHNEDGQCMRCLCIIDMKVMLSGEQCPDDPPRWLRLAFSKKPTQSE